MKWAGDGFGPSVITIGTTDSLSFDILFTWKVIMLMQFSEN